MAGNYSSRPRQWSWGTLRLTIAPGVFHPGLFFSTRVLLKFMLKLPLQGKKVLELGAGSGLLSLAAAQQGALVTATDINPNAVEALKTNASKNNLEMEVFVSDLLDYIPDPHFDLIFINPPYYPRNPSTIEEMAWFCGEDFDYFERLFHELSLINREESSIYMVLSEDCDMEQIQKLAGHFQLNFELQQEKMVWLEKNYVFLLQ